MKITKQNKLDSYNESKPKFTDQEQRVLIQLNFGISDAWSISKRTGMLITSVRRCLTDLSDAGQITENGTVYNEETNRNVTSYKVLTEQEKTFKNQLQLF